MIYLFSFLVSACVSVLNNIQRKYFVLCGLAGAFTYMAYLFFYKVYKRVRRFIISLYHPSGH